MRSRTVARRVTDYCTMSGCSEYAKGEVWPPKRIGEPLGEPLRACGRHLEMAERAGSVIQWDGRIS